MVGTGSDVAIDPSPPVERPQERDVPEPAPNGGSSLLGRSEIGTGSDSLGDVAEREDST